MSQRQTYTVVNGIRLFHVEDGEGPLVLLCHGFPESWYSWRHQIPELGSAGYRAVAPDLPGYGRSDKPDVAYDVIWLTECLAGLIAALGHEKAVIAGHDWGGLLAWPFARLHPEVTAGVIGLNTPDLPRTPVPTTEFLRQIGSSEHSYILQFQERGAAEAAIESDIDGFVRLVFSGWTTTRKDVFTDDVLRRYADNLRPRGAITPPLEYYRNMDRNWELLERFDDEKIEVPCLMVSGADDPVLPPALAEGMEQRVPDLQRVVIENCGHWTQQEAPGETTKAILGYLERLGSW
jgi:pimeloyl-ACP methyl ester carboxylesterase